MPIDSGNLALKGLDDLFSTEENRQEEQREQVQQIPMQRMFEDGTCRVRPGYYTRTIQYQDINYQLAQQEDKTAIFEEWCSFLNFFDRNGILFPHGKHFESAAGGAFHPVCRRKPRPYFRAGERR